MCGIAGIVSFKENVGLQRLKHMTDVITHRGPDGEGHWINTEGKVCFGHRRLSIIDLSANGKQPMHYADGRYTITFNGEIYNYIEIKQELLAKGYKFQSESDTEVLMALYDLKREKCLNDLDGMFSFSIWDSKEQTLFCARDRFGEKPFYYYKDENEFVFASEIKQFFAAGIKKEPNPQVLYYYLNFGIEGNPNEPEQSFFSNIVQLMPASYLILRNGTIQIKRYWDLDTQQTSKISFDDSVEKFRALFNTSLKRRLRSDVPVGSCLSGGLDSSSIVLCIDKMKAEGQTQKTFSARFKDFDKDEGKYMDMVVKKSKSIQNFDVWLTENDFLDNLEEISKHQDEPYGGTSIVAQYNVMKLAKKNGITVLIDGQGSDEYLVGYIPFFITYLNQLYGSSPKTYAIEKEKLMAYHGLQHNLSVSGKMQLKYPGLFSAASKTKNAILPSKKRNLSLII
ncbi:MAG: asparagine synthase (glutamine-hydrolyzing) [Sphingobacteriaceae bacterium]|nr:asparagine synthase (glutamine-hydrolyzing) [Sphingobacteriaceae bacterium]